MGHPVALACKAEGEPVETGWALVGMGWVVAAAAVSLPTAKAITTGWELTVAMARPWVLVDTTLKVRAMETVMGSSSHHSIVSIRVCDSLFLLARNKFTSSIQTGHTLFSYTAYFDLLLLNIPQRYELHGK